MSHAVLRQREIGGKELKKGRTRILRIYSDFTLPVQIRENRNGTPSRAYRLLSYKNTTAS
jgi:hypothetical protein